MFERTVIARLRSSSYGAAAFRHPFHDGTWAVIFDPLTFIEKLCALVPPPRANLVTYHGVFAPNSAWRARVVPDSESPGWSSSLSVSLMPG